MSCYACVVITRHIRNGEGQSHGLALAGFQQFGLTKGSQYLSGFSQHSVAFSHLWSAVINLHNFFSGIKITCVRDCSRNLYVGPYLASGDIGDRKIRIGQAIAKGIADCFIIGIKGFKVTVTGKNVFRIFLGGTSAETISRIGVKALSNGFRQFSRWGHPTGKNIANVIAALLAAVSHEDQGFDSHILYKFHIRYNTIVVDHSDLVKVFRDQLEHFRFFVGQKPAALVVLHVVVFAHDTANHHNRLIVSFFGLLDQLLGQRHFREKAVAGIDDLFLLVGRVIAPGFINLSQGFIHMDSHISHTIQHIDFIGGIHIRCA